MKTSAVNQTKQVAAKPQVAVATQDSDEEIAKKICMITTFNLSQAASTNKRAKYEQVIANQTQELSKIISDGPWATLAQELHREATLFIENGTFSTVSPLPNLVVNDPTEIESALKTAFQFTILNREIAEVSNCMEAAGKAIESLPTSQEAIKKNLTVRLLLINGWIDHKKKQPVEVPEPAPISRLNRAITVVKAVATHPVTKIALLTIAANSILYGFGVMPTWTKFLSVQRIFGLDTAGISCVVQAASSNPINQIETVEELKLAAKITAAMVIGSLVVTFPFGSVSLKDIIDECRNNWEEALRQMKVSFEDSADQTEAEPYSEDTTVNSKTSTTNSD